MVPTLFFYQLVLVALVWLCVMLHWAWPSGCATASLIPSQPTPPQPKRHREPKPFAGVTHKPHCDAQGHLVFGSGVDRTQQRSDKAFCPP